MSSPSRAILTGADAAVAALEATDADVAFGLPGVHNLSLWRALGRSPIRLVGVRHEQTAAYAADGYARARGGLGVALTTTGPGAANTLAAVGEAWASPPAGAGDRHRRAHQRAPAGSVARRAARGHGPGGDVRAGREGGDPRELPLTSSGRP